MEGGGGWRGTESVQNSVLGPSRCLFGTVVTKNGDVRTQERERESASCHCTSHLVSWVGSSRLVSKET